MWQQLCIAISWERWHGLEHGCEPVAWIDFIEPAGCQERIEYSGTASAVMRAGEEINFTSDRNRADLSFNGVVVDVVTSIIKVTEHLRTLHHGVNVENCGSH